LAVVDGLFFFPLSSRFLLFCSVFLSLFFSFLVCWYVIADTEGGTTGWLIRMGWDGTGQDEVGWDGRNSVSSFSLSFLLLFFLSH